MDSNHEPTDYKLVALDIASLYTFGKLSCQTYLKISLVY